MLCVLEFIRKILSKNVRTISPTNNICAQYVNGRMKDTKGAENVE
jgi:hypothetical protein